MSAPSLRQKILAHLGRFPERVPLMPEFEPAVHMGDYTRTLVTYAGPISNDSVTINFVQTINNTDPLRSGQYAKTLTFTLSTTAP